MPCDDYKAKGIGRKERRRLRERERELEPNIREVETTL